jgi:hypothetical protein
MIGRILESTMIDSHERGKSPKHSETCPAAGQENMVTELALLRRGDGRRGAAFGL